MSLPVAEQGSFITPDWSAPANVKAISSTRIGGCSAGCFDNLNLGLHVGDQPAAVHANREKLRTITAMPNRVGWLEQVHGTRVLQLENYKLEQPLPAADASFSKQTGYACIVMTADCLPLLLCNKQGTQVAAIHAGWRGLHAGVIEQTLAAFACQPTDILVWLGPAISQQAFEVGAEVRQAFIEADPHAEAAFVAGQPGKYFADIYQLARLRLYQAGVLSIFGGNHCTFTEKDKFFSYRRDGQTGRQASAIWLTE